MHLATTIPLPAPIRIHNGLRQPRTRDGTPQQPTNHISFRATTAPMHGRRRLHSVQTRSPCRVSDNRHFSSLIKLKLDTIPILGTYSPYPYSSAPPPLGMPTTYHTSPMRSDTLHQVTSYSPSSASTSSPYSSRRSASVGPRSHRSTVAHRPKNWRHDYRTRTGFASILPKRQTISFGSDNGSFTICTYDMKETEINN